MPEPLFYSEQLAEPGASLMLTGEEARHAAASRRLQAGDTLWLFDGHGGIARATLLRVAPRGRELDLRVEERRHEPPVKPAIHLACALPKGDRQGVLLDMATQLGLTQFTPLACARNVVKPDAANTARWRRICLESCKQSRRLYLPVLNTPATPEKLAAGACGEGGVVWVAHPSARACPMASALKQDPSGDVTIMVGPEGGFTPEEIAHTTAAGAKLLALGPAILRIEAAAVALMAAFRLGRSTTP